MGTGAAIPESLGREPRCVPPCLGHSDTSAVDKGALDDRDLEAK